jgi:hypothetical protein
MIGPGGSMRCSPVCSPGAAGSASSRQTSQTGCARCADASCGGSMNGSAEKRFPQAPQRLTTGAPAVAEEPQNRLLRFCAIANNQYPEPNMTTLTVPPSPRAKPEPRFSPRPSRRPQAIFAGSSPSTQPDTPSPSPSPPGGQLCQTAAGAVSALATTATSGTHEDGVVSFN